MISPTFPSSPPQFLLCPAPQTKARSQRAISEDSSPEIPSHSGEMVLMGKKRVTCKKNSLLAIPEEARPSASPLKESKDSSTHCAALEVSI